MCEGSSTRRRGKGFTLIELLVTSGLLSLVLAIGVTHFRNMGTAAESSTSALVLHMAARQANDVLSETLLDAGEVVKPLEGRTMSFLVVKDLVNNLRVFYLEKAPQPSEGPFRLVSYTDTLTGSHRPEERKVLLDRIKEASFTCLSPGLVLVRMTLAGSKESELSATFEVALKNLGSNDLD